MNDLKTLLADWFDPHEVSSFLPPPFRTASK